MRFIDGALPLIARGWRVFPVSPGSKLPAVPRHAGGRGVLDASREREQIEEWARRFPRANVGLACGRDSGLTVVDIDPKSGGMDSVKFFKERRQILPPTVSVRTPSGGWHLYYQYEPLLLNSKSKLGSGIDIRTSGGYVVAAGSILDTGGSYRWHLSPDDAPLARLPVWAHERLKPAPDAIYASGVTMKNESAALDGLEKFVAAGGGGERNSRLYWSARRAAESGYADQATANRLAQAAARAGLTLKESLKTIGSGFKAAGHRLK